MLLSNYTRNAPCAHVRANSALPLARPCLKPRRRTTEKVERAAWLLCSAAANEPSPAQHQSPPQQPEQPQQQQEGVMDHKRRMLKTLPLAAIRRPLGRTRENDQAKVEALAASIKENGLQEPIDVLELTTDGSLWGFNGCHRFEAHQRLGLETIKCRVRKATPQTLKMHMV